MGEISHNDSGKVYRDRIVGNFDNFTILGFPIEYDKTCKKNSNYAMQAGTSGILMGEKLRT
ncbi:MAG TPA: hypothetical protein GXX65_07025 [Methanosarcina sp.]|nr:hypothetical protein [Methanosarcina sp.]HHV24286.1 hypothetical protein [Methanosarcina sp.]